MKRLILLAALALCAPAHAQDGPPPRREGGPPPTGGRIGYGNPSAAIAADIAFARLAKAKGRWVAFRETAAPDAVMFVPQMVLAQPWLKNRAEPADALTWQPYAAWSSCDGTLIATTGAWQSGAATGWYTTIWQLQEKGGYKWVLDHGGPSKEALVPPEMLEARVAECPPRPAKSAQAPPPPEKRPAKPRKAKPPPIVLDPAGRKGAARDGSLEWEVTAQPGGAHRLVLQIRRDGEMRQLRDESVAGKGS